MMKPRRVTRVPGFHLFLSVPNQHKHEQCLAWPQRHGRPPLPATVRRRGRRKALPRASGTLRPVARAARPGGPAKDKPQATDLSSPIVGG